MHNNPPRLSAYRRSLRRRTAVLTTLALTASLLAAIPGAASADPTPTPTPSGKSVASDPVAGLKQQAKQTGKRIEIEQYRSETATIYANPDGKTFHAEVHSTPIRVRKDGAWQNIDTTLVEKDGVITPKAAIGDLALSTGDDTALAKVTNDKGEVKVFAPGKLPKPILKDNTATYPDAYGQGIDLVVTAIPTGFHQEIVFRQRPTGKPKLKVGVDLPKGLRYGKDPAGRPALLAEKTATDAKAKQTEDVTTLTPALMLDAAAKENPDAGHTAGAAITVRQDGENPALELTPDNAFLADPATVYPVTLAAASDEWYGAGREDDTFVNNAEYPSGATNAGLNRILVGKSNSGNVTWRGYIRFDIAGSPLMGGTVENADLRLWNYRANTCNWQIDSGILVRKITSSWSVNSLTWSNQPSTTSTGQYGNKGAYSDDCPNGEGELYYSIESITQSWMNGDPDHGVQLRAVSESDITNWRWYRSFNYGGYGGGNSGPRGPVLFINYEPLEHPPVDEIAYIKAGEGLPGDATADEIRAVTYRSDQPVAAGEVSDEEADAMQGEAPEFVENPGVALARPDDVSEEEWNSLNPNNPEPDPDEPSVIRTVPDLGATSVPPDVHVEARFSEPVSGMQIILKDPSGQTVQGASAASAAGDAVTFTPDASLALGTQYTAEVSGAQDADGHPMAAPYTWGFTTWSSAPTPTPTDPSGEQRTIALPVQADTWVDDQGSVGPDAPTLWAGAYVYDEFKISERIYLRFDTSALAGKTVVDAKLELWNSDAYGCGTSQSGIVAQQVTGPWNANTLTWENQPSVTNVGETTARDPSECADDEPTSDMAWTWQVKDIVQTWAAGQNNHGFMLRGVDESPTAPLYDRGYHASESGDPHSPVLKVTYIEDGGSPNPSPSPTPGPDTTPPTILDVEPADGTADVAPNAQIKVTFSEPVTDASLLLEDIFEGGEVSGQITMNADRTVLTFTPGSSLASWYWATVSGAKDDAGNTMAEPYEWWFGVGGFLALSQEHSQARAPKDVRTDGLSVSKAWTHVQKADGDARIPTTTPQFMVKVGNPGKRRPDVEVEVEHDPQVPSQGKGLIWSGSVNSGVGFVGLMRMPAGKLSNGWKARWRARATSGGAAGDWSDWQAFTVDSPAASPKRSMSLLAAEPAFSYDRIENPAQCRALGGANGYAVKNSYNWCVWGVIASRTSVYQNGKRIGWAGYAAEFALIAHSFTGESKTNQARLANNYNSRQFKVYLHVNKVVREGGSNIPQWKPVAQAAAETFPFSLGIGFRPSNKCSMAPTGLNGFTYKSPEGWKGEGGNFTFTSDPADFSAPDHRARCKLRPQIHTPEQVAEPYSYLLGETVVFRCDSSPDIKTSKGGCVVWKDGRPVFELSKAAQVKGPGNQLIANPVRESAQHIWDAWNNPAGTRPADPNKKVPGFSWGNPVQRNTDTSKKGLGGKNRKEAIAECDRSFSDARPRPPGVRYTRKLKDAQGNTIYRSCDEFPFAATHQGASKAGTNYSARPILAVDNSTSGSWLGWWFERNRVLEKQKFTVRISDSQEAGVNGYYPPPPGTDTLSDEQLVPDAQAP